MKFTLKQFTSSTVIPKGGENFEQGVFTQYVELRRADADHIVMVIISF